MCRSHHTFYWWKQIQHEVTLNSLRINLTVLFLEFSLQFLKWKLYTVKMGIVMLNCNHLVGMAWLGLTLSIETTVMWSLRQFFPFIVSSFYLWSNKYCFLHIYTSIQSLCSHACHTPIFVSTAIKVKCRVRCTHG